MRPRELHDDEEQADDVREVRDQEVLPHVPEALPAQRGKDLEGLRERGEAAKAQRRQGENHLVVRVLLRQFFAPLRLGGLLLFPGGAASL
jgi:hypothetical protein